MENTVGLDNNSNSGSDISDSWAVIDDESPLEWNNVLGLGLRSNTTLDLPSRSNSRNELSDEDSIEVVDEDHTDDLSDKEIEVFQDEECTMANQLETKKNIIIGTSTSDPPHDSKPSHQKKENVEWTESSLILIAVLVMGIVAGLCVGYLWAPHTHESKVSTSNQPTTRALLRKLQSDNVFLRRRLRSAHTYMKSAMAKTKQNLNRLTKQDSAHISLKDAIPRTMPDSDHLTHQDLYNKVNPNSLNLSDNGTCSVTDFMVTAPILQDYCFISEKPQDTENVLTYTEKNAGNNSMSLGVISASNSMNYSFVKDYIQTENTRVNNNRPKPNESLVSLQDDIVHSGAEVVAPDNSEGGTDPRPYTKLRTTVENIYTILSILDSEKQTVILSKQELLSILSQHVNVLGSKQQFTTNVQEKITSFELQIKDTTQKLLDDMDSLTINLVKNIALKIKELECVNKKLICNLKTSIQNSADLYLVDWDRITIFQKCIEDDHIVKSRTQHEIEGKCSASEGYVTIENAIYDQNESVDPLSVAKEKEHVYRDYEDENVQQFKKQTENLKFADTRSVFDHKVFPAPTIDNLEDESKSMEYTDLPIQHEHSTYFNHKSEIDESGQKIKLSSMGTDKRHKKQAKHSDYIKVGKHGKSGKKRMSDNKEQKYDESHGKTKYSNNDHVKISKHGKSGKKRMPDNKEQKFDEAYGKTKYSDKDRVKISKHGETGKKRMSDNKEQKYYESHVKTKYSDNDRVRTSKHGKSGKSGERKMSDNKEQKFDEAYGKAKYSNKDRVKISKHGETGKKRMSDNKEQKYYESHVKIKYSDNDQVRTSKHGKSGEKRMSDNIEQKYDEAYGKTKYSDKDRVKISKHGKSGERRMSDNNEQKHDGSHDKTKYSDDSNHVLINTHNEESGKKRVRDSKEKKYSNTRDRGHKRNRSYQWTVDTDQISNISGEWVTKLAHGRAEQRRRDHESDWVFDRAESRDLKRKKSTSHSNYHGDRDYLGKFFNSGVCNKTTTFQDETSKNWKVMKQCMKENIWKPLMKTAKLTKKAFKKFRYYSRRE